MRAPGEQQALQQMPRRLTDLLGIGPNDAKIRREPGGALAPTWSWARRIHLRCRMDGLGTLARVSDAARQAREHSSKIGKPRFPSSPRLHGTRRSRGLRRLNVSWLDLSGNAHLVAPGLRVEIDGQPNRYKGPAGRRAPSLPRARGSLAGCSCTRPAADPTRARDRHGDGRGFHQPDRRQARARRAHRPRAGREDPRSRSGPAPGLLGRELQFANTVSSAVTSPRGQLKRSSARWPTPSTKDPRCMPRPALPRRGSSTVSRGFGS